MTPAEQQIFDDVTADNLWDSAKSLQAIRQQRTGTQTRLFLHWAELWYRLHPSRWPVFPE